MTETYSFDDRDRSGIDDYPSSPPFSPYWQDLQRDASYTAFIRPPLTLDDCIFPEDEDRDLTKWYEATLTSGESFQHLHCDSCNKPWRDCNCLPF